MSQEDNSNTYKKKMYTHNSGTKQKIMINTEQNTTRGLEKWIMDMLELEIAADMPDL